LILLNGLFSTEIALIILAENRLESAKKGNKSAQIALEANAPNKFLSAVQFR
jgi:hypothetical protein